MKLQIKITPETTNNEIFEEIKPQLKKLIGELSGGVWEINIQKPKRTLQQNKSMWLFLTWLSEALNESDNLLTMVYFGKTFKMNWNPEMVKSRIWNPIQKATTGKESSTKITTKELTEISEIIQRNLSKKLGVVLEFPNELNRQLGIKNYKTT